MLEDVGEQELLKDFAHMAQEAYGPELLGLLGLEKSKHYVMLPGLQEVAQAVG